MIIYKYKFVPRVSFLLNHHFCFLKSIKREGRMSELWEFFFFIERFLFTLGQELCLFQCIIGTQNIGIEWVLGTMNGHDVHDGYRMSVAFAFWTTWRVIGYPCLQEEGPKNPSPLVGDFTWLEDLLITGNRTSTQSRTDCWLLMLRMDSGVSSPWGSKNTAACPYLGLWDYNPPSFIPSIGAVMAHFDLWQ